MVAASGAGVFLVIWQARAMRLEISGLNLAWPALVALGVAWSTVAEPFKVGVSLVAAAVASLAVYYGAVAFLPVTHLGMAIGAGAAFGAIAGICYVLPQIFAFGPSAAGYGVGLAVANAVGFRPTTSGSDWFAVASAVVLALVLGTSASALLHQTLNVVRARSTQRSATPIPLDGSRRRARSARERNVASAGGRR